MKKNVIALLLAVVMVSGNVGAVPALAAEATTQEAVAVEEETVEDAEEESAETEDAGTGEVSEGTTETESVDETDEVPEQESFTTEEDIEEENSAVIAGEGSTEVEAKEAALAEGDIVDSGTCGDHTTWTLTGTDDNLTLTISGSGEMENYELGSDGSPTTPWSSSVNEIKNVIVEKGITSIGNYAFQYCFVLTSVTIPESVTHVGEGACHNCNNLKQIHINNFGAWLSIDVHSSNLTGDLYLNGELLTDVIIPDGSTKIRAGAFGGCSSLTSVTIPDSVTSIGAGAFSGCTSLTSITIPDSVTSFGESVFHGCTSLTSITLPRGITKIEGALFGNCYSLTSVTIPETVTSIDDNAFRACRSLTSITIPENVTIIEECAFYGCRRLESITFPESLTYIGTRVFDRCNNLKEIYIDSLEAWLNIDEHDSDLSGNLYLNGELLTNAIIPEGITKIRKHAFSGCTGLTSAIIPESVTSIGNYAFEDCSGLTSITIPESVTSIGEDAFIGCSGLTSVYFRGNAPEISSNAFYRVVATANYPANIPTWTEEVRQDYGGTITWVPWDPDEGPHDPNSLEIPGNVIILEAGETRGIAVNYYNAYGEEDLIPGDISWSTSSKDGGRLSIEQTGMINQGMCVIKGEEEGTCVITAALENGPSASVTVLVVPAGEGHVETSFSWALTGKEGNLTLTISGKEWMEDYEYKSADNKAPWSFYASQIKTVVITEGVPRIGKSAFAGTAITSIVIPDSVEEMGEYAFYNCKDLIFATIGTGLLQIPSYSFAEDESFLAAYFYKNEKIGISSTAFEGCGDIAAYYPKGTGTFWDVSKTDTYGADSVIWDEWGDATLKFDQDEYICEVGETIQIGAEYESENVIVLDYEENTVNNDNKVFVTDNSDAQHASWYDMVYVCNVTGSTPGTGKIFLKCISGTGIVSAEVLITVVEADTDPPSSDNVVPFDIYSINDTYKFHNLSDSVPDLGMDYYLRFFRPAQAYILAKEQTGTGGQCFGMVYSSVATGKYHNPSVGSYTGANKLRYVSKNTVSSETGLSASKYIKYAWLYQFTPAPMIQNLRNKRRGAQGVYEAVVDMNNGGKPIEIGVYKKGGEGGHSLLALGIKKNTARKTEIRVYDCNYPLNNNCIITLYKTDGKFSSWEYIRPDYSYKSVNGAEISFTSDFEGFLEAFSSGPVDTVYSHIVSATSKGASITSQSGKVLELSPTNDSDADMLLPINGKAEDTETVNNDVYWLNVGDSFSIRVPDEKSQFEIASETKSVELTLPGKASADLTVNDDENNTVDLSLPEEAAYTMKFSAVDEEGTPFDMFSVSGSSGTEISAEETEDGIIIDGDGLGTLEIQTPENTIEYTVPENAGGVAVAPDGEITTLKSISKVTSIMMNESSFVYTGRALAPSVTIQDNDNILIEGTDYIFSCENNLNVGTAKVTIKGIGNYTGTIEKTFEITPKQVTPTITLSKTSFTYNGKAQKPGVTVNDEDVTLVNGTDYTASYKNNTNAGTASVVIKCKGNYTGTATKNFSIAKKTVSALKISGITNKTYNKKAQTQAVVVKNGTVTLKNGTDYSLSYKNNTNAGTASVIITGKGNYKGSVTKNFTIKKAVNKITAKNFTKVYSTSTQSLALGVKIANGTPKYASNTKSVTVSAKGVVTIKPKFIGKAVITITAPEYKNYSKTTKKITVTVNPTKTGIASITSPAAGQMLVKWKKNAVGTGYQIQYSTSSKFTGVKSAWISKNTVVSKKITNLTKGKKYYVRMRTYKTVGGVKYYSGWCTVKAVTIKK